MFFKKKKEFGSSNIDFVIVGLGNPGLKYENTRHNTGFIAIEHIAEKYGAKFSKLKFKSLYTTIEINGKKVLLVKPQTFMNNSGEAVRDIVQFYKVDMQNVIVIFDDISLDVGTIRIRRKGSDGGHNGIKSIIYLTGRDDFPRVKIGIGAKPNPEYDLANWVLSKFRGDDAKSLEKAIENSTDAIKYILNSQIDKAMNLYN